MAKRFPLSLWACIAALALVFTHTTPARAIETAPQELTVSVADASLAIKLFAGQRAGKRPAVIILHGRQGLDKFLPTYTRYAEALAAQGIDAALLSYYDEADLRMMASSDRSIRQNYFSEHLSVWSERVHEVTRYLSRRQDCTGKVGLLGFSNGGFLAVASAAQDPTISALVVFYAGIAGTQESVKLPPLLAIHGDADRVIPLASGRALVDRAKALGGEAELVVYPSLGHSFDFDATRPEAADALARATSFLLERLK
ncbi:dienelactone hydrolase family protein [Bradyrhizobium sp. HKCCYLS3077]|uniref:dienelactone hydrolase family protein n=1 Tax=unclassified Bradyrhizobium TaxID=2631580 RepID=UPI003EBCE178